RSQPTLTRSRTAATALLASGIAVGWLVLTAQTASAVLGEGAPMAAGGALAVTSLASLAALACAGLALLPTVRRGLASAADRWPSAMDPALTGGAGITLGALVIAIGVWTGGTGGGGTGPLAIFGRPRRPEPDLRPVS